MILSAHRQDGNDITLRKKAGLGTFFDGTLKLIVRNCVFCVFFPFILDIKFVRRTSRGHIGFLIHLSAVRALIFLARRIQPFLSLVDGEVEFCVLTI